MLRQDTFRGAWQGDHLVSIAGTHLYSRALGVCTIGNVYTHSSHRGRGWGARVTSAVAAEAIAQGIDTIVLNVGQDNATAQRVYERLGFEVYCEFLEGEATRVPAG
jgi:predicted GNAT family acetyltransferase